MPIKCGLIALSLQDFKSFYNVLRITKRCIFLCNYFYLKVIPKWKKIFKLVGRLYTHLLKKKKQNKKMSFKSFFLLPAYKLQFFFFSFVVVVVIIINAYRNKPAYVCQYWTYNIGWHWLSIRVCTCEYAYKTCHYWISIKKRLKFINVWITINYNKVSTFTLYFYTATKREKIKK